MNVVVYDKKSDENIILQAGRFRSYTIHHYPVNKPDSSFSTNPPSKKVHHASPAWPDKIKPALDRNHYGHVIDILPTFLDIAALHPPDIDPDRIRVEGKSLLPLFEGNVFYPERSLFWEHQGSRAVRKGDWKLVFTREVDRQVVNRFELFNLRSDRSECKDLSSTHPELVDEFRKMYEKWADKTGVVAWDSLILARNL
ncbi:MAG: hypothetical protein KFF73_09880 [Cyclobacteriaceae bacterium]|nr:hypothetical protein [Cyclobacteriaceae bacterium]